MAALSSGFAKAAIGHFGRAAAELLDDPSVVGYYDEIGSDVKQALHDRWNQRDFENFQTQELKPMVEDLEKLEASRRAQFNALNEGKVIDPQTGEVIGEIDPQSVEAVNLKANMERNMMGEFTNRTTRMMEAAQRHGNNPLVDAFMAQYMTNASTTINGIISPATKGIGPQEAADIRYKNAMANQARTASKLNAAQTDRLAKEAQDLSNMSDTSLGSWSRIRLGVIGSSGIGTLLPLSCLMITWSQRILTRLLRLIRIRASDGLLCPNSRLRLFVWLGVNSSMLSRTSLRLLRQVMIRELKRFLTQRQQRHVLHCR
jgi:hypothetical protein